MVEIVVADTGPLIALARLDLLALPSALFGRALLTPIVLAECEAKPDRGEGVSVRAALDAGLLRLAEAPATDPEWEIDPGEASSIALAIAQNAGVLIDDKAGRNLASHLGRPIIGTAGLLVLAKRQGLVAHVKPHLVALNESGYFLGQDVLADVLQLAGE